MANDGKLMNSGWFTNHNAIVEDAEEVGGVRGGRLRVMKERGQSSSAAGAMGSMMQLSSIQHHEEEGSLDDRSSLGSSSPPPTYDTALTLLAAAMRETTELPNVPTSYLPEEYQSLPRNPGY